MSWYGPRMVDGETRYLCKFGDQQLGVLPVASSHTIYGPIPRCASTYNCTPQERLTMTFEPKCEPWILLQRDKSAIDVMHCHYTTTNPAHLPLPHLGRRDPGPQELFLHVILTC